MTTKKQTPSQILAHKRALKVAQQMRYQAKLTARARLGGEMLELLQALQEAGTFDNRTALSQRARDLITQAEAL